MIYGRSGVRRIGLDICKIVWYLRRERKSREHFFFLNIPVGIGLYKKKERKFAAKLAGTPS